MVKGLVGVVLLLAGGALAVLGGISVATFGSSGSLEAVSTPLETSPQGHALVADIVGVSTGFPGSTMLGTTTIGAQAEGGQPLFVGVGSRALVDKYLFGVPYQAVRQDGSAWETLSVPGTKQPPPPGKQKLWASQSTGVHPSLEFRPPGAGSSSFVVMNADGSPGVDARITVGYVSKWVFPLSIAALVVGILLAFEGVYLLWRSRRPRTSAGSESGPPPPVSRAQAAPVVPAVPAAKPEQPQAAAPPDDWFRQEDTPSR